MPARLSYAPVILGCLLLFSCASRYKAIHPPDLDYQNTAQAGDVSISYRYGVLQESGNKKYANREAKKNIKVVAFKITNNTSRTINPVKDLSISNNGLPVHPLDPAIVKKSIQQSVPIYLLYLLLTPARLTVTTSSTSGPDKSQSYPFGLVLGPGIAAINMITAGNANKRFYNELQTHSLDQSVPPGETLHALAGFSNMEYGTLSFTLKEPD